MIKLDNVTKVINKKTVLKDIKLSFDKGKVSPRHVPGRVRAAAAGRGRGGG